MKVKRKWAALLGAVVRAASCAMLSDGNVVKAASKPVVSSSAANSTGNIGDTIVVPVSFSSESEDLVAIHGEPSFDTSVLKFAGVDYVGIPAGMPSVAGGNFGFVTTENFSSGTINVKFEVLKCTTDPITVTINNLYYTSSEADGDPTVVSANVTVNHPADQNQVEETKATCVDPGHKKVTCGVCGKVLSDEDTPVLGHDDGKWKVVKEATCKEKGTKELRCTRDNALLKTEDIPLLDHSWDKGKVTKEATCKEKGEKTYTCKVCGDTKTEAIALKEHSWDKGKVTKEATCNEKGEKTYTCSICGDTKKEAIAVKEHSWDKGKVTKEATCKEKGEKVYTCKVCGDTKKEAIAAKEHEWVVSDDTDKDGWKVVTKATTTKEGSKERVCSICGEKETAVIAKLSADPAKPGNTDNKNNTDNKKNTKSSTVKTGDTMNIAYLVVLLAAAGGAAVIAAGRRKKNK